MEQIFAFVDEAGKKLNRQIKDLDDIRIAMAALKEIREKHISIDFQVAPIEVRRHIILQCYSLTCRCLTQLQENKNVATSCPSSQESYAMLHKFELSVVKEEADKVDTLRYTWEKLLSRSTEVQNHLVALQPNFRHELLTNVEVFMEDCQHFYQDYEKVKEGKMSLGRGSL